MQSNTEPIPVKEALRLIEIALEVHGSTADGCFVEDSEFSTLARATMRPLLETLRKLIRWGGSIHFTQQAYRPLAALRDHYDRVRPDWRKSWSEKTTQPKTPNEPYGLWKLREAAEHTLAVLAGGDNIEPGSRIEKWTRHALEAYAEELPRLLPSSCSSSHPEIRYQGETCPLCEARNAITAFLSQWEFVYPHVFGGVNYANLKLDDEVAGLRAILSASRPSEAPAPKSRRKGPNHVDGCDKGWTHSGTGYNRVRVCECGAEDHDPAPGAGEEGKQ